VVWGGQGRNPAGEQESDGIHRRKEVISFSHNLALSNDIFSGHFPNSKETSVTVVIPVHFLLPLSVILFLTL
jgi:hypothetical protein